MRKTCYNLLHKRGIVYIKWFKENSTDGIRWKPVKYWTFSKFIEPPSKIQFNIADPLFFKHLINCPFKITQHKQEPYKIMP